MNGLYTWIAIGLVLIISEFFVPGFIIFFFGIASILVGILQMFIPGMSFPVCLISVCVLGTVLLFLLRRYVPNSFKGTVMTDKCEKDIDNDGVIGTRVRVIEKIGPELPGKVELHGALWSAAADCIIEAGTIVEITGKRNLTLNVKLID